MRGAPIEVLLIRWSMEDIVAVRVTLDTGERRYFLTWGRVFDAVEPEPLVEAVRPHVSRTAGGEVTAVEVCTSLQEASTAPYFYEALFHLSQRTIPFGPGYEEWRARMQERMSAGKEIHFLGAPSKPV